MAKCHGDVTEGVSVRARPVVLGSALVAVLLAASPAVAGPPKPVVFVTSYTVPGAAFSGVAVDSRSHLAYVINRPGSANDTEVINTRTGASVTRTFPVYSSTIAVDQATGLAYFPGYSTGAVTVLKAASVVKTIHLAAGALPFDATVDPTTGMVYVDDDNVYANGKSKVWVIKGKKVVTSIVVGVEPQGGAVDPTDGDVYIVEPSRDLVTVIRGTKVIKTINVNSDPSTINPTEVAVDPTRHLAYVLDDGGVTLLHGTTLKTTVTDGNTLEDPVSIAVDPANHLAYIGTTAVDQNTVAILDGATVKKTRTIGPVPGSPVYDPTNGLVIFPAADAPQISVFDGLSIIKTLTLTPTEGSVAGVDTSNGRVFVSGYNQDVVAELQTPGPGRITITRPTRGHYLKGAKVHVKFACTKGKDNTITSCTATTANGHLLPTSTTGKHHFTVKLRAAYGPAIKKTITFKVKK
jgi:DNA-binding beta-propeller fold protein YncE